MAKIYKTALGKQIDVDHLSLTNEGVIALGNMRVNARGDELGAGGKIIKTRDQIMKEYYALNTPIAVDPVIQPTAAKQPTKPVAQPPVQNTPVQKPAAAPAQPTIIADPAPIVEADPVVFNPESGLDEDDTGDEVVTTITSVSEHPVEPVDVSTTVPSTPESAKPISAANVASSTPEIRGSLASSVAKTATVTQVEKLLPKKANGIQRF